MHFHFAFTSRVLDVAGGHYNVEVSTWGVGPILIPGGDAQLHPFTKGATIGKEECKALRELEKTVAGW